MDSQKQEQKTTPDATATPRTIEQAAQECLTNLECNNYGFAEASAVITATIRKVVERELTAAKAEIALAKDDATHQVSVIAKLDADNAQLRAEVERLNAVLQGPMLMGGKPSSAGAEYLRRVAEDTESKPIIGGLKP